MNFSAIRQRRCFHCGLPVPVNFDNKVSIHGEQQPMCCYGCAAVAQTIVDAGLVDFYNKRETDSCPILPTVGLLKDRAQFYNEIGIKQKYIHTDSAGTSNAQFYIEGLTCAACVWLIEKTLRQTTGIVDVQLNYATHKLFVNWRDDQISISSIIERLAEIGYAAYPYDAQSRQTLYTWEKARFLKKMAVAIALGMQVMILAVALYVDTQGAMDPSIRHLFYNLSLLLSIPVFFYSGSMLLAPAWQDMRLMRISIHVPVALGLLLAFCVSSVNVIMQSGDIYFDSVVMFIALLLTARFLEFSARHKALELIEPLMQTVPEKILRKRGAEYEAVYGEELVAGDVVLVKEGARFPTDGIVLEGATYADESMLTGEAIPILKITGASVYGGTLNRDSAVSVRVERASDNSLRSVIQRLADLAQFSKPAWVALIDRLAAKFVLIVLLVACASALFWFIAGRADWLMIATSVLIITCPCALSIATPLALSLAAGRLLRQGILVGNTNVLDAIHRCKGVIFDKTGTLTTGEYRIHEVVPFATLNQAQCLRIAKSLEYFSSHPVAKAFMVLHEVERLMATEINYKGGFGISGVIDNTRYFLGSQDYITQQTGLKQVELITHPASLNRTRIWLSNPTQVLAHFVLADKTRYNALELIRCLQAQGLQIHIVSGDRDEPVATLAAELGVDHYSASNTAEQKLNHLQQLQANGDRWMVVGDGINDAPILKAAAVSVAMGTGQDLALHQADVILLNGDVHRIAVLFGIARFTSKIIRQNLARSLVYNLVALPLAVMGLIVPWIAATGMALSSIMVTLNAQRIRLLRTDKWKASRY